MNEPRIPPAGAESAELLVVGCGPVGLSAALAARSLGVDVVLLEAEPEDRERPGSRALYVHRETLGRLERISPGLGAAIGGFGVVWRSVRTCYRGREVYARHFGDPPPSGGLPPYASLRQVDTEGFLLEACRAAGVRFAWDAAVTGATSSPEGVTVRAADGREWAGRYLIGADGARSAVRSGLGIEMDGSRSEEYRVAVDLTAGHGERAPLDRVVHYRHPGLAGRNVLVVPFAGGLQVDIQSLGGADSTELSDPAAVSEWVPKVLAPLPVDKILWIARYPCLQRVADRFVDEHRRVLLAGEAAHLFSPLGARGMNSGIADADAAATAIGLALRATNAGRARGVVEEYDHVRRQAAHHNRSAVNGALAHLRATTLRSRASQAGAARLAPFSPRLGEWLDAMPFGPRGSVVLHGGRY